jgi:hypothetical protein
MTRWTLPLVLDQFPAYPLERMQRLPVKRQICKFFPDSGLQDFFRRPVYLTLANAAYQNSSQMLAK